MTPPASTPSPSEKNGFLGSASQAIAAASQYAAARLELAGLEAKETLAHLTLVAAFLLVSLLALALGYIFVCFTIIFALGALLHDPHAWIWLMGGFAVLHFLAAGTAVGVAKSRTSTPFFTKTLNEFEKDHQWLTTAKVSS